MTNEDRLRCMKPDEIIEFLLSHNYCPPDDYAYCQEWDCDREECWKKWLKQKVESDG